ncbi:hypothetical protein C0995_013927 [Termitomyces sp. Mi166|nr:hypothetical protein C0995_013927 [Termitomyces sp. Mi166\
MHHKAIHILEVFNKRKAGEPLWSGVEMPRIEDTGFEEEVELANPTTGADEEIPMLVPSPLPLPAENPLPSPPALCPSGRPNHAIQLPRCYIDLMPPPPPPIPDPLPICELSPTTHASTQETIFSPSPEPVTYCTEPNSFGVYHVYPGGQPSFTPEEFHSLSCISNAPTFTSEDSSDNQLWWGPFGSSMEAAKMASFAPFKNPTTFLLKDWQLSGSNLKSDAEVNHLVHSYMMISVPCNGVKHASEAQAPVFELPGLAHQSMHAMITSILNGPAASTFVLHPYEMFWTPSAGSQPEQIFANMFTSDNSIAEFMKVHNCPQTDGIENVVLGIALWSDLTHLTNFGKASLWPIYFYSANQWKSIRGKPTSDSENHLASIAQYGLPASAEIMTFMRCEIMNVVWLLLLDDDFVEIYQNELISPGLDAVVWCYFPWFMIHGMDYPEKFQNIPTFGCDTICKFSNDIAGLKKLAAWDYEDILQCSILAFEGLLPEPHNAYLMNLLFELGTWHALAKLKMHTESTLQALDNSFTWLGQELHYFEKTCAAFVTQELPSEVAAWGQRKVAWAAAQSKSQVKAKPWKTTKSNDPPKKQ